MTRALGSLGLKAPTGWGSKVTNAVNADVWLQEDKIGIDGGCCFGFQLNCLEITDVEYRQYQVLTKEVMS